MTSTDSAWRRRVGANDGGYENTNGKGALPLHPPIRRHSQEGLRPPAPPRGADGGTAYDEPPRAPVGSASTERRRVEGTNESVRRESYDGRPVGAAPASRQTRASSGASLITYSGPSIGRARRRRRRRRRYGPPHLSRAAVDETCVLAWSVCVHWTRRAGARQRDRRGRAGGRGTHLRVAADVKVDRPLLHDAHGVPGPPAALVDHRDGRQAHRERDVGGLPRAQVHLLEGREHDPRRGHRGLALDREEHHRLGAAPRRVRVAHAHAQAEAAVAGPRPTPARRARPSRSAARCTRGRGRRAGRGCP